ncbi:hypothetical protein ACIQFU_03485 [Streptomyces sp. NPDC093065]|uniref:hypothetical protein n=1 Tax=Streptomyces sp. NPDC093065 TaxID=3366021 RepID=UPI0037F916D4
MFVDSTGRRARLLRRLGLLLGAVCVGYTAVLGLAFMGVGISVSPSSLLPFGVGGGGAPEGGPGPGGGTRPQGGDVAPTGVPPGPAPSVSPTAIPSTDPTAAAPTTALTDRPDAPTS